MTQTAEEIEARIREAFKPLAPDVGPIGAVSDQFRDEQNHPAGIRAPHAIEALRSAEHVDRWGLGDSSVSIALAPRTEQRPYAALVTAWENPASNNRLQLSQAWRLYGEEWSDQPTRALAQFITRFGLEVQVGETTARFVAVESAPGGGQILSIAGSQPPPPFTASAMIRQDGSNGRLEVQWAYAIDAGAYQQYVAANR